MKDGQSPTLKKGYVLCGLTNGQQVQDTIGFVVGVSTADNIRQTYILSE